MKPTRILLIDDNALHANLTIAAFESVHFQWCPMIHNAIEFLQHGLVKFDLIVTDYMGTSHDFEYETSKIRQFSDAPMVVTSSAAIPLDAEGADFVMKSELNVYLERWLSANGK